MRPTSVKRDIVNEIHKPARRNYPRRKVVVKGLWDLWMADLVDMQAHAKSNKGFKYILTVIDVFTKVGYAVPILTKSANHVTDGMRQVLKKSGHPPRNLQTDDGKEFFNSTFSKLMSQYGINHYSTFSHVKAGVVERFNRTLKTLMWRHFHYEGSDSYIDLLPRLLKQYNNTVHSTIKMKPKDVTKKDEKRLLSSVYYQKPNKGKCCVGGKKNFEIGDPVRVSKAKGIFDKGYTANWSTEIFIVKKIHQTTPITYTLMDKQGETIRGKFYQEELQKTNHDNVYLIEKVLKKTPKKLYVKWLGFNEKGWIDRNDTM